MKSAMTEYSLRTKQTLQSGESTVMGIYESKFVLKHFGCDVSAKESSAPFLITIYTLKSVFCKDNSVEYAFDRCLEFLSGNTAADDRNTHWKHVLKVHSDSSPLAKASRWNLSL